jgi:hypothetical protein
MFFFAWVDANEEFGVEHERNDEDLISFQIEHTEGNCATLSAVIRNPRVGLLAAGRKQWAMLSYRSGTDISLLFFGRLIGIPSDILGESITLTFTAKPVDFFAQKQALAETLKVRPFYDPVFVDVDKRANPESVLEGYSAIWHVDRTTLEVTVSDLVLGEDGTVNFTADDVPYDSVEVSIGAPPLTSVSVIGTVNWTQAAGGVIDFGTRHWVNGNNLLDTWPKTGDQLSGGWSVAEATAIDTLGLKDAQVIQAGIRYENKEKTHRNGDIMSMSAQWAKWPVYTLTSYVSSISYSGGGSIPFGEDSSISGKDPAPFHASYNIIAIFDMPLTTTLKLQYDAANARNETVRFTMPADLQAIVTLPDPGDIEETLEINGSDVGVSIDDVMPIGDAARYGYFPTDRGLWSLEYLISVARAHLLAKSRAVSVSWDCNFARALDLSCRKNARLEDDRLPGGQATGKITAYSISCDGDAGTMLGRVTIQCAIGHDGSVIAVEGDPTYVENGYVNVGYQIYADDVILLPGLDDIGYSTPALQTSGLVYPLTRQQVQVSETVTFDSAEVLIRTEPVTRPGVSSVGVHEPGDMIQIKQSFPIPIYRLELLPVTGNTFAADYDVAVTTLKIPKLIDLEAASA